MSIEKQIIYHGSDHIVEQPTILLGNPYNDYGRGFYCTKDSELAKEWACKQNTDGFINKYELDTKDLNILDLLTPKYNLLNWIALLLKNRTFRLNSDIAIEARDYIIENFSLNTQEYDVINGYRADDSYFAFAESFVENGLSLQGLNQAFFLGNLGEQIVLVSEKAFHNIYYISSSPADKTVYYPKFISRDEKARKTYRSQIKGAKTIKEDIYVLDILRERMTQDDARLQRILSK